MKTRIRTLLFFIFTFLLSNPIIWAQSDSGDTPEMATGLRSNGMIFVVVGVIVIILTGLLVYLVSIDRKLSKLEKEIKEQPIK